MAPARDSWLARVPALRRVVAIAMLLVLPVAFELTLLGVAWREGTLGVDVGHGLLPQAESIRDGESPFGGGRYPPLIPVLLVPFTFLPSPEILLSGLAAVALGLTLWALEIRDWRCYGAALLWTPVFWGIQSANATLFLVCATALAWRYRERAGATAVAAGLAIGAKLISWPLAAWLAVTRRTRGAVGALVIAAVTTVGLGVLLELSLGRAATAGQFGDIAAETNSPSYSAIDVGRMLGAPSWAGAGVQGVLTLALVAMCVRVGRRGDDVRSFSWACVACLVGAPNVWLHSFSFLLPIVALRRPRFSGAWLVPLLFLVMPEGNPPGVAVMVVWLVAAGLVVWLLVPLAHTCAARALRAVAARPHG